jgi:hypothetical protein
MYITDSRNQGQNYVTLNTEFRLLILLSWTWLQALTMHVEAVPTFQHTMQLPSSGWSEAGGGCSIIHGSCCGSKCRDVEHGAVQLGHVIMTKVWGRGVKWDFPQFVYKLSKVWFHLFRSWQSLSWSVHSLPFMQPEVSSPCSQESSIILCQMNPVHAFKLYLRSISYTSFTMKLTHFNTNLTFVRIMLSLIILTILKNIWGLFNSYMINGYLVTRQTIICKQSTDLLLTFLSVIPSWA